MIPAPPPLVSGARAGVAGERRSPTGSTTRPRSSYAVDAVCPQYRVAVGPACDQRARCRRCWSTSRAAVATLTGGGVPRRSAPAQVAQASGTTPRGRWSPWRPSVRTRRPRNTHNGPPGGTRACRWHRRAWWPQYGVLRIPAALCGILRRSACWKTLRSPASLYDLVRARRPSVDPGRGRQGDRGWPGDAGQVGEAGQGHADAGAAERRPAVGPRRPAPTARRAGPPGTRGGLGHTSQAGGVGRVRNRPRRRFVRSLDDRL